MFDMRSNKVPPAVAAPGASASTSSAGGAIGGKPTGLVRMSSAPSSSSSSLSSAVVSIAGSCSIAGSAAFGETSGASVPGDVSVVGYDDSRVAHLPWADLTTIRQDTSVLAAEAVRLAVERIERAGPPSDVVVPPASSGGRRPRGRDDRPLSRASPAAHHAFT